MQKSTEINQTDSEKKVLVVDDEIDVLETLEELLEGRFSRFF